MILHKEGLSERKISEKVLIRRPAVYTAIEKYYEDRTYVDKPGSGRPRKTTPREDHIMRRTVVRLPNSSCKKIQANLLCHGTEVSISTISRRLSKEFGLKSYKPAAKPRLTSEVKKKRLAFARKHRNWTAEKWGQVLFSDESTLQQFVVRKRHVRRPVGQI